MFGNYGDKIGRKKLLVVSLMMMGAATFLIGVVPGYATIGVAAPILLVLLRLIQGFALGGEWGGAILIVSEHGDPAPRLLGQLAPGRRAGGTAARQRPARRAGRLPGRGGVPGVGLAHPLPALRGAHRHRSLRAALDRGVAGVPRGAGQGGRACGGGRPDEAPPNLPIIDVFRQYPREVLTAMGARFAENVSYYIFTIVISTYMTRSPLAPSSFVLGAVLIGAAVHVVTIPIWGAVSDRVGRKPVYVFGAAGVGIWAFAFFALLNTENFALTALAVVVGLLFHGAMYGPQAAFLSELFGTKVRYSGVSIGYQLASVVAGGLAPLISVALLSAFGTGYAIAVYVAASAVVTLVAVLSYRETRDTDLAADDGFVRRRTGVSGG